MASIFQNSDGTWSYGTSVYGSLSEAQEAERRDNQVIKNAFQGTGKNTASSGSFIGFVIKLALFCFVCSFVTKYWYIVIPIAILILALIIRSAVIKSHTKKAYANNEKIEALYQQKDYDSIFPLLKQNADKYKDPESMYCLALSYKNGEGTEPNEEMYMEYLYKAAKRNYSLAQYLYGSLLALGEENAPEEKQKIGFKFLKKSVKDSKSPQIQDYKYNLALTYYAGRGTEKNLEKAKKLFTELSNQGNVRAKEMLQRMDE